MAVIREVRCDDWCVRLDLASQMLHAEIPEFDLSFRRAAEADEVLLPTLPADAGAAVSLSLSNSFRLYARYDGRFREHFDSHQGTAGLEVKW